MEFTLTTEEKTGNIFQQLVKDIGSLKEIHERKEQELERCTLELQTSQKNLAAAYRKLAVQEHVSKTLRNLVNKEKADNTKKNEEINKLKVDNEQINRENDIFAKFVSELSKEVNFQWSPNAVTVDKLLEHIQEKVGLWNNDRQELQNFRKRIEAVIQATNFTSSKTSTNTVIHEPQESSTERNQMIDHNSPRSAGSSPLTSSLSSMNRTVKRMKHGKDQTFSPSKFNCYICKKSFPQKSGLDQHSNSAKCTMANSQQKRFSAMEHSLHIYPSPLLTTSSCRPTFNTLEQEKSAHLDFTTCVTKSHTLNTHELLKSGITVKQELESMNCTSVEAESTPLRKEKPRNYEKLISDLQEKISHQDILLSLIFKKIH